MEVKHTSMKITKKALFLMFLLASSIAICEEQSQVYSEDEDSDVEIIRPVRSPIIMNLHIFLIIGG